MKILKTEANDVLDFSRSLTFSRVLIYVSYPALNVKLNP